MPRSGHSSGGPILISLIVATYNRVDALDLVLQSLESQTDSGFEIIVADDGSKEDTRQLVEHHQARSAIPIKHVWQEDIGFRLSRIRNLATEAASGDYLVFLDGDCIVQPDFIAQHRRLAETGYMVTGGRILLGPLLTRQLCTARTLDFKSLRARSLGHFLQRQMNKFLPLFIKLPDASGRVYSRFVWRRIKGCNLACWKNDALRIGGFDESMVGWGHEDADFVFRIQSQGIKRKSGSWSTEVLHLWHPSADKKNAARNAEIVRAKILAKNRQVQSS